MSTPQPIPSDDHRFYWDWWKHEENLFTNRGNFFLVGQSMLFAGIGTLFSVDQVPTARKAVIVFCLLGISLAAVWLAVNVLQYIRVGARLRSELETHEIRFPPISGQHFIRSRHLMGFALPVVVILAWIALFWVWTYNTERPATERPGPGIVQAAESPWASFWPSFVSGLCYSVPAAIIAGLLVVFLIDRERTIREIGTVRNRLRACLVEAGILDKDTARYCAPLGADAVASLIGEYPLDLWRSRHPAQIEFVDLLLEVQNAHASFVAVVSRFDKRLHALIHKIQFETDYSLDTEGYIRNVHYQYVFNWIDAQAPSVGDDNPVLPCIAGGRGEKYHLINQDEELRTHAVELKKTRSRLAACLNRLRSELEVTQVS